MATSKTILITGATGLVGTQLIKELSGYTLHILTTNKSMLSRPNYFYWNPETEHIDTAAFDNVNAIIHLAGTGIADKRWTIPRKQAILQSRVNSLKVMYNVLQSQKHQITQLITASGIGWYGNNDLSDTLFTEHDNPDSISFLGQVCKQWEDAAFQFEQLGISVAALRTGMVLAPKGGGLDPIKKSLFSPLVPFFGNRKQLTSWIHLFDLVRMYRFVLEKELSGSFNAVADEILTNKAMIQKIASHKKGNGFICIAVPQWALKLAMGQMAEELLLFSTGASNEKIKQTGFLFTYPSLNNTTLQALNI
jgi:uncharacterized protein (TIGR01777 family)